MKKTIILLVLVLTGLILNACQSDAQFDLENETRFVVGMEADYAPFNWSTPTTNDFTVPLSGQSGFYADGYDVVMASRIAEGLGLDLVIKAYSWEGLIAALLAGEIDMIVAGMSPTPVRAETVAFSQEYFRSEQVMVVRTDGNYASATSLSDFSGARVVAQMGTLQEDLIDQIDGVIHQTSLGSYAHLVNALQFSTTDAFVAEMPVAMGIVQTNRQFTIIQFAEGNGFTVSDLEIIVSVAFRQEDVNLLNAVNRILATISPEERNNMMSAALNRQPEEE
ncbi:MAG: transporter substrate-binding domain-containing protein [Acholeplasmataceae bacterium]|nr:transporter substrate-binding domain-containing protein [Acholeplasmataceae bacterium]